MADQDETVKYPVGRYPEGWAEAIERIGCGASTNSTAAFVALEFDKLLAKVDSLDGENVILIMDQADMSRRIDSLEQTMNANRVALDALKAGVQSLEAVSHDPPPDFRR